MKVAVLWTFNRVPLGFRNEGSDFSDAMVES